MAESTVWGAEECANRRTVDSGYPRWHRKPQQRLVRGLLGRFGMEGRQTPVCGVKTQQARFRAGFTGRVAEGWIEIWS